MGSRMGVSKDFPDGIPNKALDEVSDMVPDGFPNEGPDEVLDGFRMGFRRKIIGPVL